uniref:Nucleolar protein 6 n=1 Tax=Glossina pallidipes TaxID=7398 RepID=A0A1A9ZDS7_GLOPL
INKTDAVEQILDIHVAPANKCNFAGHIYPQLLKVVTRLLSNSLGKRVQFLIPLQQVVPSWSLVEHPATSYEYLHLGLILNGEQSLELLDKEAKDVEYIAGEYNIVFKINKAYKIDIIVEKYGIHPDTVAETLSLRVIREFDNLTRKLFNLKELPFEIVSIAGISLVLRYCDPQLVLPTARNIRQQIHATQIQQGIIQLAHEFGSAFVEYSKPNWRLSVASANFLKPAVEQLRQAYSDYAAFFDNPCGGKEFAVVWKPAIFENKDFKVIDVQACSLTTDGKRKQINKDVLIEDFKFILKDFYLRVGSVKSAREASCISFTKPTTKRYFDAIKQKKIISAKTFDKMKV